MPHLLLESCRRAQREGQDFPTIWRTILRPHRLVISLPSHEIINGEACIVIRLGNGRRLLSRVDSFDLD